MSIGKPRDTFSKVDMEKVVDPQNQQFMLGDEVNGFVLESIDYLEEYHGFGYHFRHRICKMEVYHVANNDPENFFAFVFKTPPVDDCGTAHIIEHAVLAGSKRYPIRDPFMSLLKGSVNTFMNAMTYPDYTVYPAASPLLKDYKNLFKVYADAVFNPLLKEEIFWQEGIRIVPNEAGELSFDGVVYNEMLGALSDHDSIVGRHSIRSLYPDTHYYYESGGDPSSIIALNYQQFLGYYTTHYHPSNCRLFLYGNQDPSEQLELLDSLYLHDISQISKIGTTALTKRWTKPKSVLTTSLLDEGSESEENASLTISWATTLTEDPLEVLTLQILTDILLGNPGAPLYKAIIESQLAHDISQVSGMDTSFKEMPFVVGFKGIDPKNSEAALEVVLSTLKELVEKGIPRSLINNAIKRQEFTLQELTSDLPTGLRALTRTLRGWLEGLKPHATIKVTEALTQLKELVAESTILEGELFSSKGSDSIKEGYFEKWITTHLIENPHRCLLVVKPDKSHNEKLQESLQKRLATITSQLGTEGLETLNSTHQRFLEFEHSSDSLQDLATIPQLNLEDLPSTIRILEQKRVILNEVPLYIQPMESNGILYIDGFFTIEGLSEREMMLLPLFTRMLHMTDVGELSYDEVAIKIREKMGGLYFFLESSSLFEGGSFTAFAFRMKSLSQDLEEALTLLGEILNNAHFNTPLRLKAVIKDLLSDYSSNITSSAHTYASQRASSHFSEVLKQNEKLNGIEQWLFLKGIDLTKEEILLEIGSELSTLQKRVIDKDALTLHFCGTKECVEEGQKPLSTFIDRFEKRERGENGREEREEREDELSMPLLELFKIPSSVSFNALVCASASPTTPLQAYQSVLTFVLTTNHLWSRIRGLGGAYGASSHIDMLEQITIFTSYRDPRIELTLQDFRAVLEEVAQNGVEKEIIDAAIINLVGREIRPLSPKDGAMIAFRRALYNISDSFRAQRREWILSTGVEEIKEAAKSILKSMDEFSSVVVITGSEVLEREESESRVLKSRAVTLPV